MCQDNIPFEQRMKCLKDIEELPEHRDHAELRKRLKKTLYYGKMTSIDRPSLAVTEMAVEFLLEMAPKELGKIDMYWASAVSRDVSISPCALMLALIYIKRLKHANSQYLSQVSSSDLFLISMLVASKYLYDEGEDEDVSNFQWAHITHTDIEDINETERSFLSALDWNVFVSSRDFWDALLAMERKVAWRMGLKRNSFTYTDLFVITSDELLCQRLKGILVEVCKVTAICCIAYSACVMTLAFSHVTSIVVLSQTLPLLSYPINTPLAFVPSDSPLTRKSMSCNSLMLATSNRPASSKKYSGESLSCLDLLQTCLPWSSTVDSRSCFHVTTCLTIALMKELVVSTSGFLSGALSALSTGFAGCGSSDANTVQLLPTTENRSEFIHCHHRVDCGKGQKGHGYVSTSSLPKRSSVCNRKETSADNGQFQNEILAEPDALSYSERSCYLQEKLFWLNMKPYRCCEVISKTSLRPNYSMVLSSLTHHNQISAVLG